MGRKIISLLVLLMIVLSGCKTEKGNAITIDIDVIYPDASMITVKSLDQTKKKLGEWRLDNPDVEVIERDRIRNSDFLELAVMGEEHLPDVFITNCIDGRLLAERGLVLNLTGYTDGAPTLTYDGEPYAFPVFREDYSVVIYDADDPPGFISETDVLSNVLSDEEGQAWLKHMAAGDKKAAFTDGFFVERLTEMQIQLKEMEKVAISDFIDGKCSAILATGDNVWRLLEMTKEQNPELYDRLRFRPYNTAVPCGYTYGVFLNASLEKEKLEKCIELCEAMTVEKEKIYTDETLQRLDALVYNTGHSEIATQFFSSYFWKFAVEEGLSRMDELTPLECAAILQDYYERYYLNVEDYSKKIDRYIK